MKRANAHKGIARTHLHAIMHSANSSSTNTYHAARKCAHRPSTATYLSTMPLQLSVKTQNPLVWPGLRRIGFCSQRHMHESLLRADMSSWDDLACTRNVYKNHNILHECLQESQYATWMFTRITIYMFARITICYMNACKNHNMLHECLQESQYTCLQESRYATWMFTRITI